MKGKDRDASLDYLAVYLAQGCEADRLALRLARGSGTDRPLLVPCGLRLQRAAVDWDALHNPGRNSSRSDVRCANRFFSFDHRIASCVPITRTTTRVRLLSQPQPQSIRHRGSDVFSSCYIHVWKDENEKQGA